jgi:hypothetical protein
MKGGRRFHKRCFKCSTCSKKLDSTTVRCVFWTPPRSGAFYGLHHGQVRFMDSTTVRCVFWTSPRSGPFSVRCVFWPSPRSGGFSGHHYWICLTKLHQSLGYFANASVILTGKSCLNFIKICLRIFLIHCACFT